MQVMQPRFTIRVKSLVSSAVAALDVAASDTVLSVKRRLCAANARYPVSRQILFNVVGRADEPLDDCATLKEAGVIEAAELMMFLHPVDGGSCIKLFHETRSCDKLCSPGGMVVDSARERLIIADTGSHRVICIDISRASLELVQPRRVWQHGSAFVRGCADDLLSSPCGCALSLDNSRVHVADSLNHRIVTLCAETGVFLGAFGSRGALAGQVSGPRSIAVSPTDGRVWIADTDNQRVVCFDEMVAVIDQEPWRFVAQLGHTESSGASHDRFDHPRSVAISFDGVLVSVADTYNHRVQVFDARTLEYVRTIDARADCTAAVAALGNGSAAAAAASTFAANTRPLESPRLVCLHGDDLYVCTKNAELPLCVFSVSTGAWRGAVAGKMSSSTTSLPTAVSAADGVQWSRNVLGLCNDATNGTLFVSDSVASTVAMLHALC